MNATFARSDATAGCLSCGHPGGYVRARGSAVPGDLGVDACASRLRREHVRLFERKAMPAEDIDDFELPDPQAMPEHRTEESALRAAIGRLETKYREPLVLQVIGGFSCSEIAGLLGLGEAAVMTQLFRARQKLKGQLGFADQVAGVSEP